MSKPVGQHVMLQATNDTQTGVSQVVRCGERSSHICCHAHLRDIKAISRDIHEYQVHSMTFTPLPKNLRKFRNLCRYTIDVIIC